MNGSKQHLDQVFPPQKVATRVVFLYAAKCLRWLRLMCSRTLEGELMCMLLKYIVSHMKKARNFVFKEKPASLIKITWHIFPLSNLSCFRNSHYIGLIRIQETDIIFSWWENKLETLWRMICQYPSSFSHALSPYSSAKNLFLFNNLRCV